MEAGWRTGKEEMLLGFTHADLQKFSVPRSFGAMVLLSAFPDPSGDFRHRLLHQIVPSQPTGFCHSPHFWPGGLFLDSSLN